MICLAAIMKVLLAKKIDFIINKDKIKNRG